MYQTRKGKRKEGGAMRRMRKAAKGRETSTHRKNDFSSA